MPQGPCDVCPADSCVPETQKCVKQRLHFSRRTRVPQWRDAGQMAVHRTLREPSTATQALVVTALRHDLLRPLLTDWMSMSTRAQRAETGCRAQGQV